MPDSATSLRRDPIRASPHPPGRPTSMTMGWELESDEFQLNSRELIHYLVAPDILTLAWTGRLVDTFLLCLEQFRGLLFGYADAAEIARPPLDRFVLDFFDRTLKALDLCNAIRDGLHLLRHCRNRLDIAARVLASSDASLLGEARIRRARKALLKLDGGMDDPHHLSVRVRSQAWSVSRSWSASRQLQALGAAIPVPRTTDILSSAVYTMSVVLFIVLWALVATIPCQDPSLQAQLSISKIFACSDPVTALYHRILHETQRNRNNSFALLKEIQQMELRTRGFMEITDDAEFPLSEDKDAQLRVATQGLVRLCGSLKGLDQLERKVRDMFHRLVRTRTEMLDRLRLGNNLLNLNPTELVRT